MGCFFACFRARDSSSATAPTATVPSSPSGKHKPTDVVVSRNQLSTLFLSEERENSVVRDDRKSFEVGSQKGDYEVCSFLHSCYCLLCDYEFSRFVCCFWILEFSVWAECWGILFLYVREKEGVWFCSNWELYGILFVIVIFTELAFLDSVLYCKGGVRGN